MKSKWVFQKLRFDNIWLKSNGIIWKVKEPKAKMREEMNATNN